MPRAKARLRLREDVADHKAQPDYSQFFHFAFFFTIHARRGADRGHGSTGVPQAAGLAAAFLVSAAVGLYILFRR